MLGPVQVVPPRGRLTAPCGGSTWTGLRSGSYVAAAQKRDSTISPIKVSTLSGMCHVDEFVVDEIVVVVGFSLGRAPEGMREACHSYQYAPVSARTVRVMPSTRLIRLICYRQAFC